MKKEAKPKSAIVGQGLDWRRSFERTRVRTQSEKEKLMHWILAGILLTILGAVWMAVTVGLGNVSHRTSGLIIVLAGVLTTGVGAYIVFICFCMWVNARLKEYRARHTPFRPFCPHCRKYIPSDSEWECGSCDYQNTKTKTSSFLYKCERCAKAPEVCHCQHCGQTICLDREYDERAFAKLLPLDPEKQKSSMQEMEEAMQDIELKTRMAHMKGRLVKAKSALEFIESQYKVRSISSREKLRRSREEHRALHAELHDMAADEEEWIKKKFSNNPSLLERKVQELRSWVADELRKVE